MNFLANLKIGLKVWLIAAITFFGMTIIAIISLMDIYSLEEKIKVIAEEDIPLTNMVSVVTEHQLELGILLEKAMRYGGVSDNSDETKKKLSNTEHEYEKLGKNVLAEIKRGEELLEKMLAHASSEKERAEISALYTDLDKILKETSTVELHAEEVFQLINKGNIAAAFKKGEATAKEEKQLIHHMEGFLNKVEKMTEEKALEAEHEAQSALFEIGVLFLLVSIVGGGVAVLVINGILRPINAMKHSAQEMKDGDGDLTRRIPNFGTDELGETASAFNGFIEKLQGVLQQVAESVQGLSSAASQVSASSQSLSQGASEQASSLEETSASLEQMASTIGQNTDNAVATNDISSRVSQQAVRGGGAVTNTVEAMRNIVERISLIEDIAYKTNLLALNAAIEAARAGEHGKGFAVVADEVRKLAERSQLAAQEINQLSTESLSIAEDAGTLFNEMVPEIQKTADLVGEITASSEEQATGVNQIMTAVRQLDAVSQSNSASSEELASTAEEMSSQAEELRASIEFFKLA